MMKRVSRLLWLMVLLLFLTGCKIIKDYSQGTYENTNSSLGKNSVKQRAEDIASQDSAVEDPTSENTQEDHQENRKSEPSTEKESQTSTEPKEERVENKTETESQETEEKKEDREQEDKIENKDKDVEPKDTKTEEDKEEEQEETSPKEETKGEEPVEQKKLPPREERKESIGYEGKSNESLSWWYRPAKETGKGIPATINKDIEEMLDAVGGLWQVPNGQKKVYLTFDEGYEYKENTAAILDVLKEKSVPACFFITGHFLNSRPDLVKRMVAEGHLVANHTIHHYHQPEALEKGQMIADITGLEDAYQELTGKRMAPFVRPPAGAYSEATLSVIKDLGYRPVFWSFAYRDWLTDDQPDPEWAIQKIIGQLHDGSIILLHAVSDTNVAILGRIIEEAKNQGYSFASMKELQ